MAPRTRRPLLLPGCLLVLVSLLAGLATVGVIVAGALTGDHLDRQGTYRWQEGDLVFVTKRSTHCTVRPEQGESRVVPVERPHKNVYVDRWFTGSADVTCDNTTTLWQGSGARLEKFASSGTFTYGAATVIALPLIALVVLVVRRRSQPPVLSPPAGHRPPPPVSGAPPARR